MNKRLSLVGTGLLVALVLLLGVLALQGGLLSGVLAQRATPETQQLTEPTGSGRTILVVGQGTVTIQPDQAQATIGVETTANSVREATAESSEIMEALLEALMEQGVAERDIQTSGFNVWTDRGGRGPELGVGTAEETVVYRVNNMVRVTVRDLDTLSAVLDAALDAGANAIHGINFTIGDPSRLETQARIRAIANAKATAEELADLTGVRVGEVLSVSEVIGGAEVFAVREAALGMGGGAGPISPGEMDYTVRLQVIYAIR